ncbi:hypothetical protein AAC387_Pa02g0689 [Persea americana]
MPSLSSRNDRTNLKEHKKDERQSSHSPNNIDHRWDPHKEYQAITYALTLRTRDCGPHCRCGRRWFLRPSIRRHRFRRGPHFGSDLLMQREGVLCEEETNKSVPHHGNANHLKPRGQDESRSSLWNVDESREDGKRSPVCVFHCQTRPRRG